jgi:hypothetical protein
MTSQAQRARDTQLQKALTRILVWMQRLDFLHKQRVARINLLRFAGVQVHQTRKRSSDRRDRVRD